MSSAVPEQDRRDRDDLILAREAPSEAERRRAASRILTRYQDLIYAWCYRYVEDHERAMDLAQDVMMSAYRGLPNYVHRARFSSWLFVIARNCCLRDISRPTLHRVLDLDPDELQSREPGPAQRLEESSGEAELWRRIKAHLGPLEQDALHLRCVEGLPVEAITSILEIEDRSGARGLLQRARRKLRAILEDRERN